MKLIVFSLLVSLVSGSVLLGAKECTWGPSYWCSRITCAKQCNAVDHCMDTVWKYQIIKPQPSEACVFCKLFVDEARNLLKNKATEDEIVNVMSKACELLPAGDVRSECKGIITEDGPIIIQMLVSDITDTMVCATLGVCTGLEDTVSHSLSAAPNTSCSDCKRFIKDIQAQVTSNATVSEITQLLQQTVCNYLATLETACNQLVEMYVPFFLKFLADEIDPDVACRVLGFCDGQAPFHIPMKNVFEGHSKELTLGSDEECSICKEVVTEFDGLIRDKSIQDKIKEEVEYYLCGALGSLKDQCIQLIEEYATLGFDLLLNELDPATICETIGMCTTPTRSESVKALITRPVAFLEERLNGSDMECFFCNITICFAEKLVANRSLDDMMRALKVVCDIMPDTQIRGKCETLVVQYGPLIIQLLQSGESSMDICKMLRFCSAKKAVSMLNIIDAAEKVLKEPAVGGEMECEGCTFVIKELLAVLGENPTQAEIETELEKVCNLIPYKDQCESLIQQYGPIIMKMILDKADPDTVCQAIKLCPAPSSVQGVLRAVMSPVDTLPVQPMEPTKAPKKLGSEQCVLCEFVMKELDGILGENYTEEEVNAALKKVCDLLPATISGECKGFVNMFLPVIIKYLMTFSPEMFCSKIGFCPSRMFTGLEASVHMKTVGQKGVKVGSIQCTMCELLMSELKNFIAENKTEEEILDELEKICSVLPSNISDECLVFIKEYGPFVINLIKSDLEPEKICTVIGVCTESGTLLSKKSESSVKAMPVFACLLCDEVFKMLDSMLSEKATQTEVREALDRVCSLVSTDMQEACTSLVNQYTEVIINYLVLNFKPDTICEDLRLCSRPNSAVTARILAQMIAPDTKKAGKVMAISCDVCKEIVESGKVFLSDNATKAEILALVQKICDEMPDTISQQCVQYARQYIPAVLDYLEQMDPQMFCQDLSFCNASAKVDTGLKFQPSHRLGEQKCTYGPAYWCASKENAKKCNAEAHCQKHVWKN